MAVQKNRFISSLSLRIKKLFFINQFKYDLDMFFHFISLQNEDEFVFKVSDSPLAFPRLNGGGGSQKVVVIFPYSSVSAFKLKAEIKTAYRSKLCMCNIG